MAEGSNYCWVLRYALFSLTSGQMSKAITVAKELFVKLGKIWVALSGVCCSRSNTMFLLGMY